MEGLDRKNIIEFAPRREAREALKSLDELQEEIDRNLRGNESIQKTATDDGYLQTLQTRARDILAIDHRASQLRGRLKASETDAISNLLQLKVDWDAYKATLPKITPENEKITQRLKERTKG